MNFHQQLKEFKIDFDGKLQSYFAKTIEELEKKDLQSAQLLSVIRDIALAGGKRLRPFLAFQAYRKFGGNREAEMMRVAIGIELLHVFFLVHDDIMDRSDLRHGKKTLHVAYAKLLEEQLGENSTHVGKSLAIAGGDLLFALANKEIMNAGFDYETAVRIIAHLQDVSVTTIIGQVQDIAFEGREYPTEEAILSMYENKTAKYTFEGPLLVGAYAAGCDDEEVLTACSEYAVFLGTAFQIQDDLIGIFGEEEKSGKSASSDIAEGKKTLLVIKARAAADALQNKILEKFLGKKDITPDEADQFRDIITKTGARSVVEKIAGEYIEKAKNNVEKISGRAELKEFLLAMATFLEKREV